MTTGLRALLRWKCASGQRLRCRRRPVTSRLHSNTRELQRKPL